MINICEKFVWPSQGAYFYCFLKNPGEMEYFMGWLIIVEKKYKLHVISEFR